jgi:hypothetical protein
MYRRGLIGERKWIEERILRDEIGHWELDFIVSPTKSGSKSRLARGRRYTQQTNPHRTTPQPNQTRALASS